MHARYSPRRVKWYNLQNNRNQNQSLQYASGEQRRRCRRSKVRQCLQDSQRVIRTLGLLHHFYENLVSSFFISEVIRFGNYTRKRICRVGVMAGHSRI